MAEPRGSMPPASMRSMRWRCPMKLIFSMPGRPVGHAGAREQRVHRAAALVDGGVDGVLLGQVDVDGLGARQRDLGEVHHHDLGTGVLRQLGGGGAHAGGATDHQDPLAVVAECIEQCHVVSPPDERRRVPSGDDAADLEVDDGVPVDPELFEDRVTVLVELGCALRRTAGSPSNWTGAATSWNGVPAAVSQSCT